MNKIYTSTNYIHSQDENNGIERSTGITLIALVVTVIVLIILAAVTINLLLGSNGIIARTQNAGKSYNATAFKEEVEMDIQDVLTGLIVEGKTVTGPSYPEFIEIMREKGYDVTDNGDGSITLEKDGGIATVHPDWTVEVEGVPQVGGTNDTTSPEVEISYSTTSQTNGPVTVTIEANEKIVAPPGWTAVDATETKYTKDYTMNVTNEEIEISDIAGNKKIIQINISNIATGALTGNITYSATVVTHENIIATIETNREIQTLDGWEPQDSNHYTKSYNKNTTENVIITDLVGNTTTLTVTIANKYTRIYDNKGLTTAVIPDGFTESVTTGEIEIAGGKVIRHSTEGSEFVWVPVPNAAIDVTGMTDSNINASITKENGYGNYPMAIKVDDTDYKGVLYNFSGTTTPATVTLVTETIKREPAYLTSSSNADASSYNTIGITESSLQTEYNIMIASVIANGGFYIGRYETSLSGTKAQSKVNQPPMTVVAMSGNMWYGMYNKQKNYTADNSISSVTSGMIYGAQWDQVMIWMRNVPNPDASNKPYIVDSINMGWYNNNNSPSGVKNTGTLPAAKVNNIFDMAGNTHEFTQEGYDTYHRVNRRRLLQLSRQQQSRGKP